ncbi:MAG: S9 family peptidase [Pirellulaceae bacterium]|nr:S9 family peptidase [Pirellulaceae bacterium]
MTDVWWFRRSLNGNFPKLFIGFCLAAIGFLANHLAAQEPLEVNTAPNTNQTRPDSVPTSDSDFDAWLSVDRIFTKKEFQPAEMGSIVWSQRSAAYFKLERNQATKKNAGRDLIRIDLASQATEVIVSVSESIPADESNPLSIDGYEFSKDESKLLIFTNSKKVWRRNTRGDYWLFDLKDRELKKLGGEIAASSMKFAKFAPDGNRVAYVHENNLYVQELNSFAITQLTKDGSATLINGTSDWVNEEELAIRDAFRWSPDSQSIAFWQFDTSEVSEFKLIDNTYSNYPRIVSFPYPKVGEKNSATRIGIVNAAGGSLRWLNTPGDPREHYLPQMEWTPDGAGLLVQQLNRLQNVNHVLLADPSSGEMRSVMVEQDSAWIENENPVRWIDNGQAFLWLSERDGWRHLYWASVDGKRCTLLTSGGWDILQIEAVDEAEGWVYFTASPENATQQNLYRVSLQGGTSERLTPVGQPGWHTYSISSDAHWAIHTYSTFQQPPTIELIQLPEHRVVRVIEDNAELRKKLDQLKKPIVEFHRIEIGDGIELDAWSLKPPDFDSSQKYPLLFYVYGEPHGQTVKDIWSNQRGLWHWMLAQQGYVVVSVDNRGTMSPRGRDWRKVVYRQVGILASQEQAAAAKAILKQWPFIDRERVGIWGWSGGGSMSLNMIFRYPEIYRTAIAVAPVAQQTLYDSIYQERYMGLPNDNADGFRDGSPITFARQLRGNLLLVHGTGDDNVHYQATEMLIDRLIANNKYFSVLPYPGRSHSISEGEKTVTHFHQSLTQYLEHHLKDPHDAVIREQNSRVIVEKEGR